MELWTDLSSVYRCESRRGMLGTYSVLRKQRFPRAASRNNSLHSMQAPAKLADTLGDGTPPPTPASSAKMQVTQLLWDATCTWRPPPSVEHSHPTEGWPALVGGTSEPQSAEPTDAQLVQHDALVEAGCELGQGFHFARPVDPDELRRMLEAWPNAWAAPLTTPA